ncbi:MAG: Rieske 2Fe-2S domain-containing protein [Betaproteobacteria bacterium]
MAIWLKVCDHAALAGPGVCSVRLGEINVAVFRLADARLLALEDRCPHRGALLSQRVVFDSDKVACLDHGWCIRLTDGEVEPPDAGHVITFQVKVEAGAVFVLV